MNNLKRILTIALCSVLVVCAFPQFSLRSQAASYGTYALYETLLNLSGYLTTRGYGIVHEYGSSIPSISDLRNQTQEGIADTLFEFASKLNTFGSTHDLPDLGDKLVKAAEMASLTGVFLLSKTYRDALDMYLSDNTVSGSVDVGSVTTSISEYFNPSAFGYSFSYWGGSWSLSMNCESIPVCARFFYSGTRNFFIIPSSLDSWVYNALNDTYSIPGISYEPYIGIYSVHYNNKVYQLPLVTMDDAEPSVNTQYYSYVDSRSSANLINNFFADYYSGSLDRIKSGSLIINQITDTSSSDLLTSTNKIASDGTVEGDTTIYLPDQATLETAIDGYNQGSITYEDFLKIFGINSVASDATVQEKEDALTVVVTPSEDYLWFTKTQWGADSLEETRKASASTRAEEDSLADSIANSLNGGSDPEPDEDGKSRGKGLLALLLLGLGIWNTPIIAGDGTPDSGGTDDGSTDGSGDTSGYLQQSIAGMAVAGGIVEDLFSAAGGSDGYGLAYTVGASFVIFSVIIGAANYFGALFSGSDTKQNIKSSGKQTRSKSPSPKSKKGG